MASNISFSKNMRIIHRYLGFFLAGIMAMYSISGVVLVFRNTDFLKSEEVIKRTLEPQISSEDLGSKLKVKKFKLDRQEGNIIYFNKGSYNQITGEVEIVEKKLPLLLDKMVHIHKATSDDPLYFLNIFFGVSLFFFVISSFWMFRPKTEIFKKGMYFTIGGILLTLLMLFW